VIDSDGNGHNLHWAKRVVGYRIVSGNVPGGAAGENAVHNAFRSWSEVSPNLSYSFDGYVASANQAFDNRNNVFWMFSGWPYDPTLLAVTFRYFDRSDGRLLDADIVFNGERYRWSVGGSGYDIENSAAHEVGHFGGLGHSTDPSATMFATTSPGETAKRTLAPDDIAGFTALYGGGDGGAGAGGGVVTSSTSGVGGGGGGCWIARPRGGSTSKDGLAVGIALGALAASRRRRSRCVVASRLPASGRELPRPRTRFALDRGPRLFDERGSCQALHGAGGCRRLLGQGL
jgi:hypothetical protein